MGVSLLQIKNTKRRPQLSIIKLLFLIIKILETQEKSNQNSTKIFPIWIWLLFYNCNPSFFSSFISIFIPFTLIVFKYLLIFSLLIWPKNPAVSRLLLRSILLTKFPFVVTITAWIAYLLLRFKEDKSTILIWFFTNNDGSLFLLSTFNTDFVFDSYSQKVFLDVLEHGILQLLIYVLQFDFTLTLDSFRDIGAKSSSRSLTNNYYCADDFLFKRGTV